MRPSTCSPHSIRDALVRPSLPLSKFARPADIIEMGVGVHPSRGQPASRRHLPPRAQTHPLRPRPPLCAPTRGRGVLRQLLRRSTVVVRLPIAGWQPARRAHCASCISAATLCGGPRLEWWLSERLWMLHACVHSSDFLSVWPLTLNSGATILQPLQNSIQWQLLIFSLCFL